VLITPPERGTSGDQGIGVHFSQNPFNTSGESWLIGEHVDDITLSRILTIFDYMSFDPQVFIATAFGEAGSHFEWLGEPYESPLVINRGNNMAWEYDRLMMTGIFDGNAGRRMFFGEYGVIADFARSQQGRDMVIWPQAEIYETTDIIAEEMVINFDMDSDHIWIDLEDGFVPRALLVIVLFTNMHDYEGSVVHSLWDDHIDYLRRVGLLEYSEQEAAYDYP